ncbi:MULTISPECIES: AraC family transcriptional regulator [unclassified Paenibacillus]|uniref:AraC family transcriptional regulator n=1 Tax=unclassified Paenibacillus TaxID=185978 RepID=UPI00362EBED6
MNKLSDITPSIRVAHHYKFFSGEHFSENRIGYCYAFHLFDGGRGKVRVDGKLYSVNKGSLFFIRPEQVHSFYPDPVHPFRSYNIYCELWQDPALATNKHLAWNPADFDSSLLTPVHSCSELDVIPSVMQLQQYPVMQEMFACIVSSHNQAANPYKQQITRSLLHGWLLKLCSDCLSQDAFDPRIQRLMDLIEQNPTINYTDILHQSGIRKTQLHESFKKMSGMSPKSFIQKVIMKQAAAELLESSRSVSDISDLLGFSSIHYFSKRFTSYYGISPTAFRLGHNDRKK